MAAFNSFGTVKPSLSIMFSFLFGLIFPELSSRLPSDRRKKLQSIAKCAKETATELLAKAATENVDGSGGEVDKSNLGVLDENSSFLITMV